MKKYLLVCFISIFFITVTSSVSAEQTNSQQENSAESYQFELVNEENLTELEKVFVEYAKVNKGVYQFGSLYVIALGPQPNPGYGVQLEKQVQTFEQLHLYIKQTVPKQGIAYPDMISYPYIVGKLNLPPYTTLSVLDAENKKPLPQDQNRLLDFRNKRFITDSLKEWSVTFNKPVTASTLEKYRISIEKQGENKNDHPLQSIIDTENKNIVKIKPLERYEKGETYLLHIENIKTGKQMILPFELQDPLDTVLLEYDLSENLNGWVGGFSDLPVNYSKEEFVLEFGHKPIPLKEKIVKKGLLLSGMNRSDDLFMYAKKKVGKEDGLLPNQLYLLSMEIEFYTNADPGLVGIGGAPGESVYMKAGATTVEPNPIPVNDDLRMNIDKGEQASSGTDAVVIGNVAKEQGVQQQYELKKLKMTESIKVTTNDQGELWAIFGTDSGFEGRTTLYYSTVKIHLVKNEAE